MAEITLLSGHSPYDDPWHPFADTSSEIAQILAPLGEVTVRGDVDAALSELADAVRRPDLLVLNIGNPRDDSPPPAARIGLTNALEAGMPLLALHSTATTFPAWPEWPALLGGHWVRGVSFHPPADRCTVQLTALGAELTGLTNPFETVDERYTALSLEPDARPLAVHEHEGVEHPLAWAVERDAVRIVYVGLGHDQVSYQATGPRALVRAAAEWLVSTAALRDLG